MVFKVFKLVYSRAILRFDFSHGYSSLRSGLLFRRASDCPAATALGGAKRRAPLAFRHVPQPEKG